MTGYDAYISGVLNDKIPVGELVKKSVRRFVYMRDHGKDHGFYFDSKAVDRVIKFFRLLRHTSGDFGGKHFEPLPWQQFALAGIFGFKYIDTHKRVISKSYIEVPRKNGKSEFAGAIGLYMAFMDGEKGAEVYSAANAYDQASICWTAAAVMSAGLRKDSASFSKKVRVYNSTNNKLISSLDDANSFFRPVAVTKTLDGLRPHCAIIDEFHEAPTDDVLRVMESALPGRSQPLLFIITTAGFNVNGPCYQYRKTVTNILEGQKENWNTFGLIYTLDEGDDWNNEEIWVKINPSMPATPTLRGMRDAHQKAVTEGATAEVNFRTKNLNQWLTTKTRWISDDVWMKNAALPVLSNQLQWWAGLDLASTRDITAFVCFSSPDENGVHHIATFLFCPEENAKERAKRDGVPYLDWANDGVIELTPGNVADQEHMRGRIIEVCNRLGVTHVLYDPWNASQMAINLQTDGINCEQFQQTTRLFNEPIKYIEKASALGNFAHGGHAALRWMVQNVNLYIDGNGNAKINKGKSNEKVDGVVALAMAVGGYLNNVNQQSVYITENRGLITL